MRGLARPPDCVSTIPKGVDWLAAHRWWRIDDVGGGVKGIFLTLRFAWRSEKTTGPLASRDRRHYKASVCASRERGKRDVPQPGIRERRRSKTAELKNRAALRLWDILNR